MQGRPADRTELIGGWSEFDRGPGSSKPWLNGCCYVVAWIVGRFSIFSWWQRHVVLFCKFSWLTHHNTNSDPKPTKWPSDKIDFPAEFMPLEVVKKKVIISQMYVKPFGEALNHQIWCGFCWFRSLGFAVMTHMFQWPVHPSRALMLTNSHSCGRMVQVGCDRNRMQP